MGRMAEVLALGMGFEAGHAAALGRAGALHDVGKALVPAEILMKPGRLTAEEMAEMREHPRRGHEMLKGVGDPELDLAATIALEHHESWDGSGYPYGLVGDAINKEARIVTVCDAYDAVRTKRSYKAALDHEAAVALILGGDGRTWPDKFDPAILQLLEREPALLREEYARIS